MLEKPITSAADESPRGSVPLRAISWPELLARLAAARDLRTLLSGRATRGKSAFSDFAAIRVHPDIYADQSPFINVPDNCVNPDALADGKQNPAIEDSPAPVAAHGDREMT